MPRGASEVSGSILVGAAMGAVFFLIPAIMLASSITWLALRMWRGEKRGSLRLRVRVAVGIAREPLQLSLLLMVAGVVLAGFVSGDLGATTYLDVARSTLIFMVESLTEWSDSATSEAIALRGFGFIVIASSAIVAWSLWRFYGSRWQGADQALRRAELQSD